MVEAKFKMFQLKPMPRPSTSTSKVQSKPSTSKSKSLSASSTSLSSVSLSSKNTLKYRSSPEINHEIAAATLNNGAILSHNNFFRNVKIDSDNNDNNKISEFSKQLQKSESEIESEFKKMVTTMKTTTPEIYNPIPDRHSTVRRSPVSTPPHYVTIWSNGITFRPNQEEMLREHLLTTTTTNTTAAAAVRTTKTTANTFSSKYFILFFDTPCIFFQSISFSVFYLLYTIHTHVDCMYVCSVTLNFFFIKLHTIR